MAGTASSTEEKVPSTAVEIRTGRRILKCTGIEDTEIQAALSQLGVRREKSQKSRRVATLRGGAALEASLEMAPQHWCMLRNTGSTEVVPRQKNTRKWV